VSFFDQPQFKYNFLFLVSSTINILSRDISQMNSSSKSEIGFFFSNLILKKFSLNISLSKQKDFLNSKNKQNYFILNLFRFSKKEFFTVETKDFYSEIYFHA
jgi:hypothetical protein